MGIDRWHIRGMWDGPLFPCIGEIAFERMFVVYYVWMFGWICQFGGVGKVVVCMASLMRWYVLRCLLHGLCDFQGRNPLCLLVCEVSSSGRGVHMRACTQSLMNWIMVFIWSWDFVHFLGVGEVVSSRRSVRFRLFCSLNLTMNILMFVSGIGSMQ